MTIRVSTGSRLHFGLLSLVGDDSYWPDRNGKLVLPARRFGSMGLMVEKPCVVVQVKRAPSWSAEGPLAERALAFAQRFAQSHGIAFPSHHIIVARCPAEHVGLGLGTQLGLAVAKALAASVGLTLSTPNLAGRVQRGRRSGLGVHGFEQGGFLVDGGKGPGDALSPLLTRIPFPQSWHVLLVMPPGEGGIHGKREVEAFTKLGHFPNAIGATDALCRLALLGILPAILDEDMPAFSEALYDFNARVGEAFSSVQGGTYASPRIAQIVTFLREQGVTGVGQSSWGPTVFAISNQEDHLHWVGKEIRSRFSLPSTAVIMTEGRNRGAALEMENEDG